ncbi:MAG TPA: hypothetical protein VM533_07215, partial [Fimbriiglobus sp.]|nr:hypothetical protein [Fimbriiglobus sp.]
MRRLVLAFSLCVLLGCAAAHLCSFAPATRLTMRYTWPLIPAAMAALLLWAATTAVWARSLRPAAGGWQAAYHRLAGDGGFATRRGKWLVRGAFGYVVVVGALTGLG